MLSISRKRDFCCQVKQFCASSVMQVERKNFKVNHDIILSRPKVPMQCFLLFSHSGCVAVGRSGPNLTKGERLRCGVSGTDRHSH